MKVKCCERLQEALNIENLKPVDLVRMTGLSKSTISQYLSGAYEPKQGNLSLIADALGNYSEAWLMGYNVPRLNDEKKKIIKLIPLKGQIACGQAVEAIVWAGKSVPVTKDIHCDYALQAVGSSMIGARINDGDFVFIRENAEVRDGDIVAVMLENDVTLKRIRFRETEIVLKAENPDYDDIHIKKERFETVKIVGKCVACQIKIT
ncbi:MAG: helix-turn-helix domain-containing protein [Fusobacteriaceae bacterium]|jgi:repressor LexA|nr:helix-turn-helix domain-containing protein [Fusobacteriaceae bacterium]